jgi:hypothetical protein
MHASTTSTFASAPTPPQPSPPPIAASSSSLRYLISLHYQWYNNSLQPINDSHFVDFLVTCVLFNAYKLLRKRNLEEEGLVAGGDSGDGEEEDTVTENLDDEDDDNGDSGDDDDETSNLLSPSTSSSSSAANHRQRRRNSGLEGSADDNRQRLLEEGRLPVVHPPRNNRRRTTASLSTNPPLSFRNPKNLAERFAVCKTSPSTYLILALYLLLIFWVEPSMFNNGTDSIGCEWFGWFGVPIECKGGVDEGLDGIVRDGVMVTTHPPPDTTTTTTTTNNHDQRPIPSSKKVVPWDITKPRA